MADFSRLIQITVDAAQAVREYTKLTGASTKAARSTGAFTSGLRNAGFQIADFATMVSFGGDKIQAFAIQGGQAISMLGVWGAVAGTAITVGGLLVSSWQRLAEEGETLNQVQEEILATVNAVTNFLSGTFIPNIVNTARAVLDWTDAVIGLDNAMIILATVTLVALRKQILLLFQMIARHPVIAAVTGMIIAVGALADKWEIVTRLINAGLELVSDSFLYVTTSIEAWWDGLMASIVQSTSDALSTVANIAVDLVNQIISGLNQIPLLTVEPIEAVTVMGDAATAAHDRAAESAARQANATALVNSSMQNVASVARELWDSFSTGSDTVDDFSESLAGGGGAAESLAKTEDAIKSLTDTAATDIDQTLIGSIDGFLDMVAKGEKDFEEFAKNIVRDIAKIIAKMAILRAFQSAFGGFSFGGSLLGGLGAAGASLPGATAAGVGAGALGVGANAVAGGGGAAGPVSTGNSLTTVNVINQAGPAVQIDQRTVSEQETELIVRMAVNATRNEFSRQMQTGSGEFARSMEQGYTSRRRVT